MDINIELCDIQSTWTLKLSPGTPVVAKRFLRIRGKCNHSFFFLQQHSDSDSESEFPSQLPSIPTAIPVTGESYCNCENQNETPYCSNFHMAHRMKDCQCGEEDDCEKASVFFLLLSRWSFQLPLSYRCIRIYLESDANAQGKHVGRIEILSSFCYNMCCGISRDVFIILATKSVPFKLGHFQTYGGWNPHIFKPSLTRHLKNAELDFFFLILQLGANWQA